MPRRSLFAGRERPQSVGLAEDGVCEPLVVRGSLFDTCRSVDRLLLYLVLDIHFGFDLDDSDVAWLAAISRASSRSGGGVILPWIRSSAILDPCRSGSWIGGRQAAEPRRGRRRDSRAATQVICLGHFAIERRFLSTATLEMPRQLERMNPD